MVSGISGNPRYIKGSIKPNKVRNFICTVFTQIHRELFTAYLYCFLAYTDLSVRVQTTSREPFVLVILGV